jgi:hypothetical protein
VTARTFDQLVDRYPPDVQALARRARALVLELLPKAEESVDSGGPYISYGYGPGYTGVVCYITVNKKGVNLGLAHGADLPDPRGLLEGTGKRHRHVVVERTADLSQPGLKPLVRAALRAWRARGER